MSKTYEKDVRAIHRCSCPDCCGEPTGRSLVNTRQSTVSLLVPTSVVGGLVAGLLAQLYGHRGNHSAVRHITGLDRNTIARGQRELDRANALLRAGCGDREPDPKHLEIRSPEMLTALEELLADGTAGDPVSGMKWTHRSLRTLRKGLKHRGFKASPPTIARLLRDRHFSLRTCRKNKAGAVTRTGIDSFAT